MISFNKFVNKIEEIYDSYAFELRYGQTVMNTLYLVWPEKYNQITKGEYDCFYDDSKASILLDKLSKEWPDGY